jgi:hypothetical protein
MRDLVLAMCGGYGAGALRPLLRSLRATGSKAEIVLLLHGNPPGTGEALRAEGATPVEVELPGVPAEVSYNVARWAHFADQLAARKDVERALCCDARDVVFQRDPFAIAQGDTVHLCEEHPSKPIGACIWTSSWIRYRYGDAALGPLSQKPSICSGIVIGRAACMRDWLAVLKGELTPPMRSTNYMAGYDQGVVNACVYWGRFRGLVVHAYAHSPVLHLGNAPAGAVGCNAKGEVLNDEGEVVAAVHQYDRHPELAQRLQVSTT